MLVDDVASMIGVSSATIRNWVKAGHLNPSREKPLQFREEDAIALKTKIVSGSLGRLRSRANKVRSESHVVPKEYSKQTGSLSSIIRILELFKLEQLDLSRTVYFAALRLMELNGEAVREAESDALELRGFRSWKREAVKAELSEWDKASNSSDNKRAYALVYSYFEPHGESDPLGLLYQTLCSEGLKVDLGSYYTPTTIIENALKGDGITEASSFLDPCCGTGSYLLGAANNLKLNPDHIIGIDIDDIAVRIARLNLLLAFPAYDRRPRVWCANTLTEIATGEMFCDSNDLIGNIDFIATNPPWGAFKNSSLISLPEGHSISGEAFSLFLAKSLTLLKAGGFLSFLLPESILRIKTHSPLRKHLLSRTKIIRITKLGRVFNGVFTPVVRIDLIKEQPDIAWRLAVEDSGGSCISIEQSRFASNRNYDFDVEVTEDEDGILKRIYAIEHITLAGKAVWALGVVTGDNKRHLSRERKRDMEPIYRGSDVTPFKLGSPQTFICFCPEDFQQVAKEWIYRAPEKLIYKFISNSLVFAYDREQCLTLNSANILIPNLPGISTKAALAFLNSHVFQYIFKKRSTHKVLRGDLETFPFPKISLRQAHEIEQMVDAILAGENGHEQLQEYVFRLFSLTDRDIDSIRSAVAKGN